MTKAERTRAFIIEKAAPVFNKKGYAGTSLTDLIEATGLTKGAIYGNFKSKDEVASAVYNYSIRTLSIRISTFLRDKATAPDKLFAFTGFYRQEWKSVFEKGGCPIQNASVEADDNPGFLKKQVQESIKGWVRGISGIIVQGQKEGAFRHDAVPADQAYALLALLEGGIMLGKIMNDKQFLFNSLDRMDRLVKEELMIRVKK